MPKCRHQRRKVQKGFALAALFIISFFSLSLGIGLCLTKSPQAKAEFYLSMAVQYQEKAETELLQPQAQAYLLQQSYQLIGEAIAQEPYNPELWKNLSLTLAQLDQGHKALQARNVAITLGLSDLPPLVEMQSLLPESHFAQHFSPHFSQPFSVSESLPSQIMMR